MSDDKVNERTLRTRAPLMVSTGRHPHEITLLVMCLISGFAGFLTPSSDHADSLNTIFPGHMIYVYFGSLIFGSGVALSALVQASSLISLKLERAGLTILTGSMVGLAGGVAAVVGFRGIATILLVMAYAIANVIRVVQINRDIKLINRALENPEVVHVESLADPRSPSQERGGPAS